MSDTDNKEALAAKKQQETNKTDTSDPGRRKLLKAGGVVASSALVPEKWQKPVVDTVMLPAHAQTSTPLRGSFLLRTGSITPTRPAASMMAQSGTTILDTLINPAHATVTPSAPTPTPVAPTPSPCIAFEQCVEIYPPNASSQVAFTITNVGTGMLNMTGQLTYTGMIAGIDIDGSFTDPSFTTTTGSTSGGGCPGTYSATIGDDSCIPGVPTPTPV